MWWGTYWGRGWNILDSSLVSRVWLETVNKLVRRQFTNTDLVNSSEDWEPDQRNRHKYHTISHANITQFDTKIWCFSAVKFSCVWREQTPVAAAVTLTSKLDSDPDILKMYLHTENKVAKSSHWTRRACVRKIRKYLSRSSQMSPTFHLFIGHISTKLHWFLNNSFWDIVRRDTWTDRQHQKTTSAWGTRVWHVLLRDCTVLLATNTMHHTCLCLASWS